MKNLKTYLVPIKIKNEMFQKFSTTYYMAVHAYNIMDVTNKVIQHLKNQTLYELDTDAWYENEEHYDVKLPIQTGILFTKDEMDDIINKALQQYKQNNEDQLMSDLLYDTIYMGDYNKNISDLALIALPESWTSDAYQPDETYLILKRYLSRTYERLQDENKIIETSNYLSFNTGLFTSNYETIYLLAEKLMNQPKEWSFKEFCTEYRFDLTDITELPERADYFKDPSLLIFDARLPVRVQYGHILDDEWNMERLPKCISESKMKLQLFKGAIDISIKKVIANYKLAIPQYYNGKIQLLIPIYFEDDTKPDLALAVTKKNGYYQGHTCLTLDMAYNNARLIAKPESNWLNP